MTAREREILDHLLSTDFPGVESLRTQASTAHVVGRCSCGCATIDLDVDRSRQNQLRGVDWAEVLVESHTKEPKDLARSFGLLLWVSNGWLSGIEIYYYDETIPTTFPPAEAFQSPRHSRT